MNPRECLKSPTHCDFTPEFFALAVSTGVLYHFGGFPLDDTLNCYLQLFIATLTLFFGMALLPLRLVINSSPTSQRWIHDMGTATLAAAFTTLVVTVINSALFSLQSVSWASEWGLIVLAIGVVYKLINVTTTSWFQQYIKVVFFALCVAIAGVYMESLDSIASTINFSSVLYQTYRIHHFGLVPCTFGLAVLLLILGVAVQDSSTNHFVSVAFKEVFATLTVSVGCITLLIGGSLTVCASALSSAMVGGFGVGGDIAKTIQARVV